ncbi:sensor histidine kinase [Streptomyces sp. H27-D2]|uniref:sensor histidine kinase n=1 Tax=Streptomyces sp. H27-D2 TaxID=3046304 RepID=UPI002DBD6B29|nr:nitrate- and nitrite sensing domain-containing protein [Streptomyces sp. H27-D2]MEC4018189.1 nitrate- and nitrite sensing domain-containing protein [Streptomyces sp. H27-D2]
MSAQVAVTVQRLLDQSEHLRADVAAGEHIDVPLSRLMADVQAERTATAARWAGGSVSHDELRDQRAATDRAADDFLRSADRALATTEHEEERYLSELKSSLTDLAAYRERTDAHSGGAERTIGYYSELIEAMIRVYQNEFSHAEDAELIQQSGTVVTVFTVSEMVARETTLLELAGPSRRLSPSGFAEFVNSVGSQRYQYDEWVAPYLTAKDKAAYDQIIASDAWKTKVRIEDAVISDHQNIESGIKLPKETDAWRPAYDKFAARLDALNVEQSRALLAHADAKATQLETEVIWLIVGNGAALLAVAAVIVLTTRSVLRRLRGLHQRTVVIAEDTLPDVVSRLQRGQPVDDDALPAVSGEQDEVGRISDAFARVVSVSVDGHAQLAAERHGFGMFAAGIASRTGNLVSRQLTLTDELQDTFGHDKELLAQLMRSDQLTVGMRRQIENLLILAGGEIPDPHIEPMRVADLLREAAAEVEDFRRIERQALDEISVAPRVISEISHLLAELLDNATRFSPPKSKVVVRAELVTDGLSIEVEDRGPRVTAATYEEMNGRLHSAPPYSVLAENAHRLGLFVVGHLTEQLRAKVTLRRSVYGGTSAVVILPKDLLIPTEPVRAGKAAPRMSAPSTPAPSPREEGKPELVLHTKTELPNRRTREGSPERPVESKSPVPPLTRDGDAKPALPERVPQAHIAEQLRAPRAPETAVDQDAATPEEVADAWADYEHGTQSVEEELRQDQP